MLEVQEVFKIFISSTFESLADASNFSTCQLKPIRAEGGTGVIHSNGSGEFEPLEYHRGGSSEQGFFPK